jgi:hypothetical protein
MEAEMANQSFDVNWTDVDLMNQRTDMSCWAASAAMVVGWRDRICLDPAAIAAGTGDWAAYANGLKPADIQTLANSGASLQKRRSATRSMACASCWRRKARFGSPPRSPHFMPSS